MPESRFPLSKDKLPKLRVDAQTIASWQQTARDEIRRLLVDRQSWYYTGPNNNAGSSKKKMKSVFDKKGVTGFSLSDESARKKEFYCEGLLRLSLEDIAYALYCEDTHAQRIVNAYLDEEYFLDAAVLDVYAKRSLEDPFRFAGVKWVAYNSPPGVVTQYSDPDATTKSDFVYFEYSCKARDADGKVVLVQYISSPLLTAEQLQESHAGLARGKHAQINTFRFMDEGTQYKALGSFEAGKQVPIWVGMKAVLNSFSSTINLVGLADARAISGMGSVAMAPTTKACYLCKKKFGLMRARLNCHSCGQCICRQCTLKVSFIDEKGLFSKSTPLLAEDKFCLQCVNQSREQRLESGSLYDPVDSISSEESNTTLRTSLDEQHQQHHSYDDTGFSDLHDNDVEGCVAAQRQLFDQNGARRKPKHEPVYTDKVVSIKGSSRALWSPQAKSKSVKLQPKLSPVEVYLARAKAEQQQQKQKGEQSEDQVYNSTPVASSDMFSKLTESIAAQEKLLASIQQEARKIRSRATSQEYQSDSGSPPQQQRSRRVSIPESDRFEVVA